MLNIQSTKITSFHILAINTLLILFLILNHFLNPYIYSQVYLFFNGFYLLLAILIYTYIILIFRVSSISGLSYLSLLIRSICSIFIVAVSIICLAFVTSTSEIIQAEKLVSFLFVQFAFQIPLIVSSKIFFELIKPKDIKNVMLVSDVNELQKNEIKKTIISDDQIVHSLTTNKIDRLVDLAIEKKIEAVYVYINSRDLQKLENLIEKLSVFAFELYWILPTSLFANNGLNLKNQIIRLNPSPVILDSNQYILKRSLDVFGTLLIIMFALPIFIIVPLLIKIFDKGPIFYAQNRNGLHGKPFKILKFRTLKTNSGQSNKPVLINDPRVTLIGNILRKTAIDELPQLFNVLKGEMSLVGPRPHIPYETDLYSKEIFRYLVRHQVKPGLTGLAQINIAGKTNVELMRAKLDNDLKYIYEWSIYLDLRILASTPFSLWRHRKINL